MNKIEKQAFFENKPEIMDTPEISIKEEKGVTLLSILLRGYKQNFGNHDHELSCKVDKFFKQNPFDKKSVKFLSEIKALEENGVDEETLFNMALTYNNENQTDSLFEFISKHKENVKDSKELRKNLLAVINNLENNLPEELKQDFNKATFKDIKKREENIEDLKERIKKLIDFFNPKASTTKTKKVIILPTNFLMSKKSGTAFNFKDNLYISSHVDNLHNLEHEFLHCVINPIVDKLDKQLSSKQKQKISHLASNKLKVEQGYGQEYYSLLCEEFIRTYNDILKYKEKPITYNDFVLKVKELDEDSFLALIQKNKTFKSRCEKLDIKELQEFKSKSKEYFNRFEKNELRDIIYNFYQKYIQEKEKDVNINFEDFVLKKFEKEI